MDEEQQTKHSEKLDPIESEPSRRKVARNDWNCTR